MRRSGRLRTSQATSGRSSGYFVLVVKVKRESRCDNRPGAAVLRWWGGGSKSRAEVRDRVSHNSRRGRVMKAVSRRGAAVDVGAAVNPALLRTADTNEKTADPY